MRATHCLGVGERAQSVVVLLAGRVPQPQVNRPPVHHYIGGVVVEDGGDVLPGKGVCGIADQEACLT